MLTICYYIYKETYDYLNICSKNMTWIDISIIALCALAIFIGYFKGFLKSLLSLVSYSLVFLGAFLLAKPTAAWLMKITNWDTSLSTKISTWLSGISPKFDVNMVGMNSSELSNHVNSTINTNGFPGFLRFLFGSTSKINPEAIAHKESFTMNNYISQTLTILTFIVVCFVVFVIVFFLVKYFLHFLTDKLTDKSIAFKATDKTLGCVFGLIRGLVWVFAFIGIFALFRNLSIMNGINATIEKSFIAKPLSNLCYTIIDKYFNLNSMIRLISIIT